jgi:hypothetical protein
MVDFAFGYIAGMGTMVIAAVVLLFVALRDSPLPDEHYVD